MIVRPCVYWLLVRSPKDESVVELKMRQQAQASRARPSKPSPIRYLLRCREPLSSIFRSASVDSYFTAISIKEFELKQDLKTLVRSELNLVAKEDARQTERKQTFRIKVAGD